MQNHHGLDDIQVAIPLNMEVLSARKKVNSELPQQVPAPYKEQYVDEQSLMHKAVRFDVKEIDAAIEETNKTISLLSEKQKSRVEATPPN